MSYLELLGLVGVGASAIGAWLALYALINNRTLKTETRLVRESLQEESRLTRESLKEESEETRKILKFIADLIERGFKDTIEVTRTEGAQTRSLIKTT